MKIKKEDFFPDFYKTFFAEIEGIKFTRREIDIIAFIISGRSAKKIASFLSLSSKTVDNHTHNIMVKLGCNSRESIIDFIEKSGKLTAVRAYYSNFLSNAAFEKCLRNISFLKGEEKPVCLIVFWQADVPQRFLIDQLVSHLNLAGIVTTLELRENAQTFAQLGEEIHENTYVVYAPHPISIEQLQIQFHSQEIRTLRPSAKIPSAFNNKLFLLLESEAPIDAPIKLEKQIPGFDLINLADQKSYYDLAFEILKKILPNLKMEKIIEEFEAKRNSLNNFSIHASPEIYLEEKPSKIREDSVKFKVRKFLKGRKKLVSALCLVGIGILSLGPLAFKEIYSVKGNKPSLPYSKQANQEDLVNLSIRSDLVIPTESVLLGRPELLNQIESKFKEQPKAIQTLALVGIGGSGKTTLARQYARSQDLPVVWEINAETKETLMSSLENLAYALSKTEEEKKILRGLQDIKNSTEREEKLIQFVKDHLRVLQDWFLIYDNVEKFSDIQKYFPSDPATWGKGKIILTTRNEHTQNNMHIDHAILLEALNQTQQIDLFIKIMNQGLKRSFTLNEEKEIYIFLENLPPFPLDISIATYYLKATNISYEKYLERLKERDIDFERIRENILEGSGDYKKTRYNIIALSLRQIINANEEFTDLLLLISLIDSQNIPRELLTTQKNRTIIDDFIYKLKKYSLLTEMTSNQPTTSFSMHRSTQTIILQYLDKSLNLKVKNILLQKISNTLEKCAEEAVEREDFSKIRILINHFESFLSHGYLLNNNIEGVIRGQFGILIYYLSKYLIAQKHLKNSLNLLSHNNENYARIARYSGYLGNTYRELSDYKNAKFFLEQSLQTYQKFVAEEQADLPWVLVNLGIMYKYLEDYKNAKIFFEQALEIKKKKRLEADPHTAWVVGNLASIYSRLGDNTQAKILFEHSLAIYEKNYDLNHPKRAWILIGLGTVYGKLFAYEKAKDLLKKALLINKNFFAEDSIKIAFNLLALGQVYFLEGRPDNAEIFFNESLAILKKNKLIDAYIPLENLAELNLEKASHMLSMGDEQQAQNFKIEARKYFNQAIENLKPHLPINSPQIIRIENKLQALQG